MTLTLYYSILLSHTTPCFVSWGFLRRRVLERCSDCNRLLNFPFRTARRRFITPLQFQRDPDDTLLLSLYNLRPLRGPNFKKPSTICGPRHPWHALPNRSGSTHVGNGAEFCFPCPMGVCVLDPHTSFAGSCQDGGAGRPRGGGSRSIYFGLSFSECQPPNLGAILRARF